MSIDGKKEGLRSIRMSILLSLFLIVFEISGNTKSSTLTKRRQEQVL